MFIANMAGLFLKKKERSIIITKDFQEILD